VAQRAAADLAKVDRIVEGADLVAQPARRRQRVAQLQQPLDAMQDALGDPTRGGPVAIGALLEVREEWHEVAPHVRAP
jgi:hypothetical protein